MPASIDDVIAVYREVFKTHSPPEFVISGTSFGSGDDRRSRH